MRLLRAAYLERPDDKDREDAARLTQTHLEQVSENQEFRALARLFQSVRYLHIVPHVVREFRRDGDYRDDPFGSDFPERIAATNKRSRGSRLKRIQEALRAAVPQFEKLELERDLTGEGRDSGRRRSLGRRAVPKRSQTRCLAEPDWTWLEGFTVSRERNAATWSA